MQAPGNQLDWSARPSDRPRDSHTDDPRPYRRRAVALEVIRVFLVDDHEVVRRGLAALLDTEDDIEVVGEAGTVADAMARAQRGHPGHGVRHRPGLADNLDVVLGVEQRRQPPPDEFVIVD